MMITATKDEERVGVQERGDAGLNDNRAQAAPHLGVDEILPYGRGSPEIEFSDFCVRRNRLRRQPLITARDCQSLTRAGGW
jgi:hypothetical protein